MEEGKMSSESEESGESGNIMKKASIRDQEGISGSGSDSESAVCLLAFNQ